jgi:hypothetical protein
MIGRISVAATAICIGACASSGPEAPAPAATASSAPVEAVAADTPSDAAAGEIQDLDAPNVELTANVAADAKEDEIVCRREIITGTRMSHRVCRSRADIEKAEAESQDALRKMRKTGSQLEKGASN